MHCGIRRSGIPFTEATDGQPCAPIENRPREISNLIALIKACTEQKNLQQGIILHDHILKRGLLQTNCYIGSSLVNMYAKCGAFAKAAQILDELSVADVVTWSALIAGYAEQQQGSEALRCFEHMKSRGVIADIITYISLLKACGSIAAIDEGEQVHTEILSQGFWGKDLVLDNSLIDMYVKCGTLARAALLFDELPVRNVVSWSSLIAGYAQHWQADKVLLCFEQMKLEGISPNTVTFISILKACGSIGSVGKGEQIHKEIRRLELLENDIVLGTALADMYIKCRELAKAAQVLEELSVQDAISWSALITGFAQQGQGEEAWKCFERMQEEGFYPNAVTLISILKACGNMQAADKGEQIYHEIVRLGLLAKDLMLGNALIDMYAKCGAILKAKKVLDSLAFRDLVSWNALLAGHAQHGYAEEAMSCFEQLQCEGLLPDTVTFACIFKACRSIEAVERGEQIHFDILGRDLIGQDPVLRIALVDMYVQSGALDKAAQVLHELPFRDVATWSVLIGGYAQQEHSEEALDCFLQMLHEGITPNPVTFTYILKACGNVGATDKGELVHKDIVRRGLLAEDTMLATSLVDMYAKFGALAKAAEVLVALQAQNVVSWTALIAGYARQGLGNEALKCFEQMQSDGFHPNRITFSCVFSACSRSGFLDKAQVYFADMSTMYDITPDMKHHTSMVALFCRAGRLDEALMVIKSMPPTKHFPVWIALLSACCDCGNVELGRLAFNNAVAVDKDDATAYILMSKIYSAAGMVEDAIEIAAMRNSCSALHCNESWT